MTRSREAGRAEFVVLALVALGFGAVFLWALVLHPPAPARRTTDRATTVTTADPFSPRPDPAQVLGCLPRLRRYARVLRRNREELERQLTSLSATATGAAMVHDLVSATRKQATFKPSELVMREILCIASALMDETFPPDLSCSDSEADDQTT